MRLFTKVLDSGKTISYPTELETAFQYLENETGLDRSNICKKLGIKTLEEKYDQKELSGCPAAKNDTYHANGGGHIF